MHWISGIILSVRCVFASFFSLMEKSFSYYQDLQRQCWLQFGWCCWLKVQSGEQLHLPDLHVSCQTMLWLNFYHQLMWNVDHKSYDTAEICGGCPLLCGCFLSRCCKGLLDCWYFYSCDWFNDLMNCQTYFYSKYMF